MEPYSKSARRAARFENEATYEKVPSEVSNYSVLKSRLSRSLSDRYIAEKQHKMCCFNLLSIKDFYPDIS